MRKRRARTRGPTPITQKTGWLMTVARNILRICDDLEREFIRDDEFPDWLTAARVNSAWLGALPTKSWKTVEAEMEMV